MSEPLTFELCQHTPLLHFHAVQEGATLRASEVKPRFDRWLIDKVWKGDFEKCKRYLIGYGNKKEDDLRADFVAGFRALNYKMRIIVEGERKIEKSHDLGKKDNMVSVCPMYFGNETNTVFATNKVVIVLTEATKKLQMEERFMEKCFIEFINSHNFGARSSKGYGSFTIGVPSIKPCISLSKNLDWRGVMNRIDLFYKTIRSGINFMSKDKTQGYYFKSMLYSYAQEKYKGSQWDKKVIKDLIMDKKTDSNKIDVRDFMGFSTIEKWGAYKTTISKSIKGIKRFASPIVFKPFKDEKGNWNVFLIINEIPNNFKNKEVVIKAESKSGVKTFNGMKTASDFSVKDYFEYLFIKKPEKISDADWLTAADIKSRFEKGKNMGNQHQKQINNIVDFYKKLREAYKM